MATEIDMAIRRADAMDEEVEFPEPTKAQRTLAKRGRFNPPFVALKREDVEAATGLSRTKIYAMMNPEHPYYEPTFPRPLRFGARSVRWRGDEITKWMLTRERTHAGDDDA